MEFGRAPAYAEGVWDIVGPDNLSAAEAACKRAMAEWPNEPRFAGSMGRVLQEAYQDAAAYRYFRSAAERGDPYGLFALGQVFVLGRGGPRDEVAGLRTWRAAAHAGFARAQYEAGSALLLGFPGNVTDEPEGVRLVRLAAEADYMPAQFKLAEMCEKGLNGVPRDEREAVRFYQRASAAGNPNATAALRRLTGQ